MNTTAYAPPVATALVEVWVAQGPLGYRALIPALGLATEHYASKPAALHAAGIASGCTPRAASPVQLQHLAHPAECLSGGYFCPLD